MKLSHLHALSFLVLAGGFLVVVSMIGCASTVDVTSTTARDPITYCNYASVDFRASTCTTLEGGLRVVCPTDDGTMWARTYEGTDLLVYTRYEAIPGTLDALHNLCVCDSTFCASTFSP